MAERHLGTVVAPARRADGAARFDAFISYSHALDGMLAPALQIGLERFAKPWYRPRALRVFRDDASMSANVDLWSTIEEALSGSSWLVLMASPDAARSPWVDREVAWWLTNKTGQRLLVVLTEGEFAYADGSEPDPAAALPPALRGAFTGEPRWVDLRWLHDTDQVSQSNPRLRDGVADVAAAVHGVPKDTLVGEHIRQHRRTVQLARGAVVTLVVLLLAAIGAAVVARDQQQQAEQAARTATARLLGTRADATIGSDPRQALMLAIAAQAVNPGGEAHAGLVASLSATRYAGILIGHRDGVRALALARDRGLLASASNDGTTILWELTDPARPRQLAPPLSGHGGTVEAVAFNSAGTILATGTAPTAESDKDAEATIQLWDVADPSRPRPVNQPIVAHRGVKTLAFAPGAAVLVSGGEDHTMIVWDVADPAHPRQLGDALVEHGARVRAVAFGRNAATMFSSGDDGQVIVWDLGDPLAPRVLARPVAGQLGAVGSLAFAPETNRLVTVGVKGSLIWDVIDREHPRQLGTIDPGRPVSAAAFGPGGGILALAGADRTASLWNVTDPSQPQPVGDPLAGHRAVVRAVAFTPDGTRLLSGSDDSTILVWDVTPPTQPHLAGPPATGPGGLVSSLALDDTGQLLAAGNADGSATLWDVREPARPRPLGQAITGYPGPPTALALTGDGRVLATANGEDFSIQLWDVSAPQTPRPLGAPLRDHSTEISCVLFVPGNRYAVTASTDGATILWDIADPAHARPLPRSLTGPAATPVNSLAVSPDGRILASAGDDGTVGLWDIGVPAEARPLRTLPTNSSPVNAVTFTADGATLAAASNDGTVALWDVRTPTDPRPLGQPLRDVGGWIRSIAFSPDATMLAAGSDNGVVTLFDLSDRTRPRRLGAPLEGPTGPVTSLVFTPNGQFLAAPGRQDQVLVWDLASLNDVRAHALEQACARAGRGLDDNEWSTADIEVINFRDTCPPR